MASFKFQKEDLMAIVLCLRLTNFYDSKDSEELSRIKQLTPGVISILLDMCFGNYNSNLIWKFAIYPDKSQFDSMDQLYDYLIDPCSSLVSDKAISLQELVEKYPEVQTLLELKQYIDEKYTS
jgi:hypothetical protein